MVKPKATSRFYFVISVLMFAFGLGPLFLNVIVDPYEVGNLIKIDIEKEKISEKSHYPLWKMAHYPGEKSNLVILGDSRARALRDKYWHELGVEGAYNFAYGGATLHEVYDTFRYVRANKNLRTLVVGIQLRSFDLGHKGGMNRVPEAIRLSRYPLKYYSNWFISRIGVKLLDNSLDDRFKFSTGFSSSFIPEAHAAESPFADKTRLDELLLPERCANCILPQKVNATPYPVYSLTHTSRFQIQLGKWGELWRMSVTGRNLTGKFERQVLKNAASDWQSFEAAELFWSQLSEISIWCRQNNIDLIFFIPPTIIEMQHRIAEFGFGAERHNLRKRLVSLGTVVDFDFDSELTRNLANFTDAYHFNYKISKQIVGELALLASPSDDVLKLAEKRRKEVFCPVQNEDVSKRLSDDFMEVSEGRSCRIWRALDE